MLARPHKETEGFMSRPGGSVNKACLFEGRLFSGIRPGIFRVGFAVVLAFTGLSGHFTGVHAGEQIETRQTPLPSVPLKTVLVLNSYHKGFPWSDHIVHGIEETFAKASEKIDLWTEYMDTKRFPDESYFDRLHSLYIHKFRNKRFEAIITSDNAAFQFVLRYRQDLFGDTPIVFCGVNRFVPEMLADAANITGIAEHADFRNTILLAPRMLPGTREIVIVSPNTISANEDRKLIEGLVPSLGAKLRIVFWQGLDLEESLERATKLSSGSVILSSGVIQTRSGHVLSNIEKVKRIAAVAPVPVLVVREDDLGSGALGGRMVSGFAQGRQAASFVLKILRGKKAKDLPVLTEGVNSDMFDFTVMRRFRIFMSDIPEKSIVINRPEQAHERYHTFMTVAGGVILFLGIFVAILVVNIFKRRRAEEALRESEERLKAIIDHSPTAISLEDLTGRYVLANGEFSRRYGVQPENLVGKKVREVLPPAFAEPMEKLDSEVIETLAVYEQEIEMPQSDGTRSTFMVTKFPVFDAQGNLSGVGGVSTDVSDMKKASEAMRTLQTELAHVSRLSTMGEMAAGFAHELNQPLAAISNFAMGCVHRLKSPAPDIETIVAALHKVSLQAQRASDIIRSIRRFVGKKGAQRIDGILPPIDINTAIQASADLLRGDILQHGASLSLSLSPALPLVQADAIQIQQVVINLARNSMEAMDEANCDPRDLAIQTTPQANDSVEIRVVDTGPGILDDVLPQLFNPFFTTKTTGMGMGLSICRSIVDQHGGQLTAANQEQGGAEFRIVLPVFSPQSDAAECR